MSDSQEPLGIENIDHRLKSLRVVEVVLKGALDRSTNEKNKDHIFDMLEDRMNLIMLNFELLTNIDEHGSGGIISSKPGAKRNRERSSSSSPTSTSKPCWG